MIISLIIIGLILSLGFMFSRDENSMNSSENRKLYIKIICFFLILQSGLRNVAVGADTYAYYLQYSDVSTLTWKQIFLKIHEYYTLGLGKAPGYLVFQKTIQYILPDYQLYLFLIALIFFSALGTFIYRNTSYLSDAILAFVLYSSLFFSFFSYTGHRQTIATAFTLFGYELIKKRKFIPFLIVILIASTIHRSCLAFLPFYFVVNIKNTKIVFLSVLLIFPLLMKYREVLNNFLINLGDYKDFVKFEGAGTHTFTVMLLLVAIVSLWRFAPVVWGNSQSKHFYNALALALFFTPLTWVNPSAMRIVQYFSIFMLLLIPAVIQSYQNESLKIKSLVYGISIVILIGLLIKSNLTTEYKFFWQEMELGPWYNL